MKKQKFNPTDIKQYLLFTYEDLFDAFVAGDCEQMRKGGEIDREEFNEWFMEWYKIKVKKQ